MGTLKQICPLVLVLIAGVYSQQCRDCVNYIHCPNALSRALNSRTPETLEMFKRAFCGFDNSGKMRVAKVCCSVFSAPENAKQIQETPEDIRIANHKNLELLSEDCGYIKGDRIVGGSVADLYEFPWMALISHENRYGINFKCGGTIINKRYILTAAHCVYDKKIAGIRVGEYDLNNDIDCVRGPPPVCERHIQDIPVQSSKIHENFDHELMVNDIALIRLAEDIQFNHLNVHRICLPTTSELRHRVLTNQIATVTGWGVAENHMESPILRKVNISVLSADHCSEVYNRFLMQRGVDASTNQFCAGAPGKDSCTGDSGGPLMIEGKYNNAIRFIQYGIVSHGPSHCGSGEAGAYADVSKFMGWILDNISP